MSFIEDLKDCELFSGEITFSGNQKKVVVYDEKFKVGDKVYVIKIRGDDNARKK